MSRRRRAVIRVGLPMLVVVVVLVLPAFWRLGTVPPVLAPTEVEPATTRLKQPPITRAEEMQRDDAVGRLVALDRVRIIEVPSARTLWLEAGANGVFAVLDPDVKRGSVAPLAPGDRVALVGVVRRVPRVEVAIRDWRIDAATARRVEQDARYLYVTELRPGSEP